MNNKKRTNNENNELNVFESDLLLLLNDRHHSTCQKEISGLLGKSVGLVNKLVISLKEEGYIEGSYQLSVKAKKTIEQSRPKNAIILAAGFGMRMVPINLSTPKAFLEVKGEKLIERIIKQLHEVGIEDITIVVGFMKDSFEYLIDEFGVKLAYAPNYARKNNIDSLATVADKIHNTYIVPCDVWCSKNPFNRNELYSWYMVSDEVDDSSAVRVNRKMELIRIPDYSAGNRMIGISYLSSDKAEIIKNKIKDFASDNRYDNKFWEETLFDGDRMIVYAKTVQASNVVEINTYEQLRELDANSNVLKSDALETIAKNLNCKQEDIVDIEVLKKGMTNRSFLFRIKNGEKAGKYIMRIPGEGTEQLINRKQEAEVYAKISGLGFCDDPVYINSENGYKITKYIEGVHCCDPLNDEELHLCMKKLRTFHNFRINSEPLRVNHVFDLFERVDFYESLWEGNPSAYRDYEKTKENCKKLIPFIEKHKEPFQLTHIDAVPDNFLFDPNTEGDLSIQLTDWEYAGMQDKHVDIAMFCIYSMYDKSHIDHLIDIYFEEEGGCNKLTRAKIYCYISICGLIWSNWCEYKRNLGVEFGEYSLYQYRYGKEYFKYATELMKEIGESID